MQILSVKRLYSLLLLCLMAGNTQAADEGVFLNTFKAPAEQSVKLDRSVAWALPLVATQYQPQQPLPVMKKAVETQDDGRFLEALILLDDAIKSGQGSEEERAEINLLRASFLLQGGQFEEVREMLTPLQSHPRHAASAYALTAMTHLQQGRMQEALHAAQQAHSKQDGMLPPLVLSYALQAEGRLAEARDAMHGYNSGSPNAITLAREAELDLTLDEMQHARKLLRQAREKDAVHPYVAAVSGLSFLIDGQAGKAKAGFEAALKRDPKDPKMLLGLGLAEIKLGNQQAGLKKLQAANEADPNNALILTYLGRAEMQAGQEEKARASWRSAQQADRNDPAPWLYQAQAELQASQLQQAQASVGEAQARTASRAVYRGERLLQEDEQLLQANLAEIQRRQGLEGVAFHTLADPVGEKNSATLRNMAGLLEGRRFGESARRSLLLQSLFNEKPGSLPATLDIYGDGAGQTGASTPQHGVVSELTAQRATYHNYDELFGGRAHLEADAIAGNQNTNGEQLRFGVGNDLVGVSMVQRRYKTDGNARFEGLDNSVEQAAVQWRPVHSTQIFALYQTFDSKHGETFFPADPINMGVYSMLKDSSRMSRLGARHNLAENSELRGLWSYQQTDQVNDQVFMSNVPPYSNMAPFFGPELPFPQFTQTGSSGAHSAELQYRCSGGNYATQWGVQQTRGRLDFWDANAANFINMALITRQGYAAWQQQLSPSWQLDAQLGWGKLDNRDNIGNNSTYLTRWLPKLGVAYAPDAGTHVRLAAWRGMTARGAGDATLAPASLAGIALNRSGDNAGSGKLVQAVSASADRQFNPSWLLAAQVQRRMTDELSNNMGQQILLREYVDESRLALHWQGDAWNARLAADYERIQNDSDHTTALDSVAEQRLRSLQLMLRWFMGAQYSASLAWSHNRVSGAQKTSNDPINWDFTTVVRGYENTFNQVDVSLDWQFIKRGSVSAGVRNARDKHFQYADIDRLNPRFSNGRLAYIKARFTW